MHPASNAFTKSWCGGGYRRVLAEVSGMNDREMIACMPPTNLARRRQKSYCCTTSVGPLLAGGWSHPAAAEHKGYAVTTDAFLVWPAAEVSVRPPKVTAQRSKVVGLE